MRLLPLLGAMLSAWLLATDARADRIEYSLSTPAPEATVAGGGRSWTGLRMAPGTQFTFRTTGGGDLRLFYFQEYVAGKQPPREVRLLVAVDGAGKMFPLLPKALPGLTVTPAGAKKTLPTAPMPVTLRLSPGEHVVVVRLAPTVDLGGVLALPDAVRKAPALADLDLDAPDELALDLDLSVPTEKAVASLDLDLDLDAPAKPTAVASLDLDLDPAPAPPVKQPEPAKPAIAAAKPVEPAKPAIATAKPVEPAKPAVAAAKPVEPPKPAEPAKPAVAVAKPPVKKPPTSVAMVVPAEPELPEEPLFSGPPPALGALEIGPRAGWAMTRGRLQGGQPVYLLEVAWRLESFGLPQMRAVAVGGFASIDAGWTGIEPGLGKGWFQQTSRHVPLEVGVTYEPFAGDRFSPYVGLALAAGFASTSLTRFSLPTRTENGVALGAAASIGARFQVSSWSLVAELRHSEAFADLRLLSGRPGVRVGEPALGHTAALGGVLFSF